jgi:hypothetical protein
MEELLQQLIGPGGLLVFLLFTIFAGWKGWWRFGRDYDACVKEKDEWKATAMRLLGATEKLTDLHSQREE